MLDISEKMDEDPTYLPKLEEKMADTVEKLEKVVAMELKKALDEEDAKYNNT